jgi:hypothetical protein
MFRSSTILRELVWSLAKVTLYFVRLCGAVAACLESDMCVVCCGSNLHVISYIKLKSNK